MMSTFQTGESVDYSDNILDYNNDDNEDDDDDADESAGDGSPNLNVSLTGLDWLQHLNGSKALANKHPLQQSFQQPQQPQQQQQQQESKQQMPEKPPIGNEPSPVNHIPATNLNPAIQSDVVQSSLTNYRNDTGSSFQRILSAPTVLQYPRWSIVQPLVQPCVPTVGPISSRIVAEPFYPAGLVGGNDPHRRPGLHLVGPGRGLIGIGPPIDYKTNGQIKPPYSYATLIWMAMQATSGGKVSLSNIYDWIQSNFAYFKYADCSWQNSIRHNLSMNKCFEKVPRGKNDEPGKGGFWRLNPVYLDPNNNPLIPGGTTYRPNNAILPTPNAASVNCARKRRCIVQPSIPIGLSIQRPIWGPPVMAPGFGPQGLMMNQAPHSLAPYIANSMNLDTRFSTNILHSPSQEIKPIIPSTMRIDPISNLDLVNVKYNDVVNDMTKRDFLSAPETTGACKSPNILTNVQINPESNSSEVKSYYDINRSVNGTQNLRRCPSWSLVDPADGSPTHDNGSDALGDLMNLSYSSMMGEDLLSQSGLQRLTEDIKQRFPQELDPNQSTICANNLTNVTKKLENETGECNPHIKKIEKLRLDIKRKYKSDSVEEYNVEDFSDLLRLPPSMVDSGNLPGDIRGKDEINDKLLKNLPVNADTLAQESNNPAIRKESHFNNNHNKSSKKNAEDRQRADELERLADILDDDLGLSFSMLPFTASQTNDNEVDNDLFVRGVGIRPSVVSTEQLPSDAQSWEASQGGTTSGLAEDPDDDIFGFNPDRTLDEAQWFGSLEEQQEAANFNDLDLFPPNFCSDVDSIF